LQLLQRCRGGDGPIGWLPGCIDTGQTISGQRPNRMFGIERFTSRDLRNRPGNAD